MGATLFSNGSESGLKYTIFKTFQSVTFFFALIEKYASLKMVLELSFEQHFMYKSWMISLLKVEISAFSENTESAYPIEYFPIISQKTVFYFKQINQFMILFFFQTMRTNS